jgi:polyhydroxyalkanoate synthase subunit PhaC
MNLRGQRLLGGVSVAPFEVNGYDNRENIRVRKYATGGHIALQYGGVRTVQTAKEVLWEKGKARLYRYEPAAEKRYSSSVGLVYALILRPYLLYLLPGNNFVEYLVGEGFNVYLLGWDAPESEDSNLSFEILNAGDVA